MYETPLEFSAMKVSSIDRELVVVGDAVVVVVVDVVVVVLSALLALQSTMIENTIAINVIASHWCLYVF